MMHARASRSDLIKMKSGKTVEGRVVEQTSGALRLDINGVVISIPRDRIESIGRAADTATTEGAAHRQMEQHEKTAQWPDLYDAATAILTLNTSDTVAAEKQRLAAEKIREGLFRDGIAQLMEELKFDEAITSLSERLRQSGLSSRPAGAVGRRVLAEIHLANAARHLSESLDGHVPLALVRKAREIDPSAPGLDHIEAIAQMHLHNFDEAIRLLEKTVRVSPKDIRVLIQLMICYREKSQFEKIVAICDGASTEISKAINDLSDLRAMVAEGYRQAALGWAERGRTAEAGRAYERFVELSERKPDQLRDAAAFFERIGDFERARKVRSQNLRARPSQSRDASSTLAPPQPQR